MQTFEEHLNAAIQAARTPPRALSPGECQTPTSFPCHLCHARELLYEDEIRLKNEALQKFWQTHGLGQTIQPLVPSPMGRAYRTVTKRKAFLSDHGLQLALITPTEHGRRPLNVVKCAIEPAEHNELYKFIRELLDRPRTSSLAEELSYVVIKGNYKEQTIIFNVRELSGKIVRIANTVSKFITEQFKTVIGIFLFEGNADDTYYLSSLQANPRQQLKKIFGKNELFLRVGKRGFLYSPLSFSQVNQSLVEQLVAQAGNILRPDKSLQLFDLYCGYGLFALSLAEQTRSVVGAEIARISIDDAMANAERQRVTNTRFMCTNLDAESIPSVLKTMRPGDLVLLDPPRKGTAEGVIEEIAARKPVRVVHLFCEVDLMPSELKRWKKGGYAIQRAIPFDMFSGTNEVEMVVLLEPEQQAHASQRKHWP